MVKNVRHKSFNMARKQIMSILHNPMFVAEVVYQQNTVKRKCNLPVIIPLSFPVGSALTRKVHVILTSVEGMKS